VFVNGCCFHLAQADLLGSLPSAVYTFAMYAKADAVAIVKGVLDKDKRKGLIRNPPSYITSYSGRCFRCCNLISCSIV
jgi:hypothetical protein